MHVLLLILTAGALGFLHSILPDHWVPLAVIARTDRWSLLRTARVSWLASTGHVLASIILSGIVALVGLQFRQQIETQQGRIIGTVLVLTGIGFLLWGLTGHGHHHDHEHGHDHAHSHTHNHPHPHEHGEEHEHADTHEGAHTYTGTGAVKQPLMKQIGAIAVSFGVAASPDLTVLPVAIAASLVGVGAVIGVLVSFSVVTMATFVLLTVVATIAGYQIKGDWLETHANTITAIVLIAIGVVAFVGF